MPIAKHSAANPLVLILHLPTALPTPVTGHSPSSADTMPYQNGKVRRPRPVRPVASRSVPGAGGSDGRNGGHQLGFVDGFCEVGVEAGGEGAGTVFGAGEDGEGERGHAAAAG